MKKEKKILLLIISISLVFALIALLQFSDNSFTFAGLSIVFIGIALGYYFTSKRKM